ncbi:MAG: hydroxyisourate hydrolase [Pseudonocardiales bacterium]
MSAVTTHLLDTMRGRPAAGVPVRLEHRDGTVLAETITDDDGRATDLGPDRLGAGDYRLIFDTAALFDRAFYPEVTVTFTIADPDQHHHVPLLLSPFGYSTYRGS